MPNTGSDWDNFEFETRYDTGKIKTILIDIEAHKLSLNQLFLPPEWVDDLHRLYIVRSVHGTTAIEGNPLSQEDVSQQLLEPAAPRRTDQVHRQTENAATAFKWIEENFSVRRGVRLEDILKIHDLLTSGSDEQDNVPGRLRAAGHNVTVGSPQLGGVHHSPPRERCLTELLDRFLRFMHSRAFADENTVIQALVAHFYFVTLHPFGDGNGRATRCIEAAILYSGGYNTHGFYSLSNYFYRNRDDYCRLLQETRTRHGYDLTAFLLFGLRGFREELERINAYVRNRTHRLLFRDLIRRCTEQRVRQRRRLLNTREADLLHRILDITKPADPFGDVPAREATWKDLLEFCRPLYAGKSTRTMIRELSRLHQHGFLQIARDRPTDEWRVRLDFNAIRRY